MSRTDPVLLPVPKKIELSGRFANLGEGALTFSGVPLKTLNRIFTDSTEMITVDGSANPVVRCMSAVKSSKASSSGEWYRLTVRIPRTTGDPAVVIEAETSAGLRHGLYTFKQLLFQYHRTLPSLIIEDFPSFPVRGVMLDISRNRVPLQQELLRIVELLASLKINHLQLYTEHTFAYRGHETVWKDASPVTGAEIRQLDSHCRDHGITLAANQNCFGHMTNWLKHEKYAHLAETHGDWLYAGQHRSGQFSLCPTDPGSVTLIEDLLSHLLPLFSSGLVNIGCDETFDVGQGRSAEEVDERGFPDVYYGFIGKIVDVVKRHRFTPMFWADMAVNHPESLGKIPPELTALAWGYEPDTPFGRWVDLLHSHDLETWVCPGTSSWRSITGRTTERHENIVKAGLEGFSGKAEGFLVTDWGDMGHRQQWSVSVNAFAEAANAAWNAESAPDYDPRASSMHVFGDISGTAGLWLDRLGDMDYHLRQVSGKPDKNGNPTPLRNASCLFTDLHTPLTQNNERSTQLEDWRQVKDRLADLSRGTPAGLSEQVTDELKHTCKVAAFAVDRAIARREKNGLTSSIRKRLSQEMRDIISEHCRLWLRRSRTGGLEESCRYYTDITEELEKFG